MPKISYPRLAFGFPIWDWQPHGPEAAKLSIGPKGIPAFARDVSATAGSDPEDDGAEDVCRDALDDMV